MTLWARSAAAFSPRVVWAARRCASTARRIAAFSKAAEFDRDVTANPLAQQMQRRQKTGNPPVAQLSRTIKKWSRRSRRPYVTRQWDHRYKWAPYHQTVKPGEGQLPIVDYRPWGYEGLTCPAAPGPNLGALEARGNTFNAFRYSVYGLSSLFFSFFTCRGCLRSDPGATL